MTTKNKMLLVALILGATTNIALGLEKNTPEQQAKLNEKFLWAAYMGDYKKVEKFLKNGANINAKDKKYSQTALHRAASNASPMYLDTNKEYLKIVSILIENGIDHNSQIKYEGTAAHLAAKNCNEEMLRFMYKKGVNLTTKNSWKESPSDRAQKTYSSMRFQDRDIKDSWAQSIVPYCEATIAFLEEIEKAQKNQ